MRPNWILSLNNLNGLSLRLFPITETTLYHTEVLRYNRELNTRYISENEILKSNIH
jgi:hypothetical protein